MKNDDLEQSINHRKFVFLDILTHRRTRSISLWVALIMIVGTVFYHFVEGWSLVDSFYFSFISLATVGYGDFVPTTTASKLFTVFYIANGLGVLVAFVDLYASLRIGRPIGDAEQIVE